jgi:hypothetical protein
MYINKKIITIFLFGIILNGNIIFPENNLDKDPNEISNYYKELIDRNILNSLSMLETINESIFNIIIGFIPEDEIIENYYYMINLNIIDKDTRRQIAISEIIIGENGILNLPENSTVNIEYSIYYYEILFNKYSSWRGDPTGKCFSVLFDENNIFIRRYFWR